jgi:hypothetical protein
VILLAHAQNANGGSATLRHARTPDRKPNLFRNPRMHAHLLSERSVASLPGDSTSGRTQLRLGADHGASESGGSDRPRRAAALRVPAWDMYAALQGVRSRPAGLT